MGLKTLQGGDLELLHYSTEQSPSPAANGSAVHARHRRDREEASAAWADPLHAAAAHATP